MTPKQSFRVVIVGRPNVGKSTLFNRLIGRRRSLVHNLPGVTRDRIEGTMTDWNKGQEIEITVIDTGGLGGETFADEIQAQVNQAIAEAQLIVFLLDGSNGLQNEDQELWVSLKRTGICDRLPLIGVVNKVDVEAHEDRIIEFYNLGLDHLMTISAEHGRGVEDLRREMVSLLLATQPATVSEAADRAIESDSETSAEDGELSLTEEAPGNFETPFDPDLEEVDPDPKHPVRIPRVAIVGRPNVGKSTLVNTILGKNRVITSPIAGTTVDSIDTLITHGERQFCLVDTAGIRRKNKTEQGVEVLSVVQAKKALDVADIAILVLNGEEGISDQDEKIGGMIEEAGCAVILLLNKWDTQKGTQFTQEMAAERVRKQIPFLKYAPIVFASALRKTGLNNLWDLVEDILHQRKLRIPTHEFTEWVRKESEVHNPKNARFYLCHQSGKHPPTFVCHVNKVDKIDFSLKRHLVNALRDRWGYMGSPVRMLFVEGSSGRASAPRK